MTTRSDLKLLLVLMAAAWPAAALAQQTTVEGAEEAPIPAAHTMGEWPCVQGKVLNISLGQVWDGPPIDGLKDWYKDPDVTRLVSTLATRRVPLDKAEAELKKFAEAQPEDKRDARLTLLFAGLFDKVNGERRTVVHGIEKYQKSQKDRAAELEQQSTHIAELDAKAKTDETLATELESANEKFQWASRIFQDRQTSIPLACELPTMIEQRLYSLSHSIRALMKS